MLLRGLLGAPTFCLYIYSTMTLPSQIFTVMINLNIVYSVILGPCLMNEWPTIRSISMVLLSLLGVILITDPSMLGLGNSTSDDDDDYPKIALFIVFFPSVTTVIFSAILSKYKNDITPYSNGFYPSFFVFFICAYLNIFFPGPSLSVKDTLLPILGGIIQSTSFFAWGQACKLEPSVVKVNIIVNV